MGQDKRWLGVDVGGTNITAAVVDDSGRVLGDEKVKTKADQGSEAVLDRIVKAGLAAVANAKLTPGDLSGAGIGAPGAIDPKTGVVLEAVNLRWTNFPLAEQLGKQLSVPVVVDNDVNVGAWGEYKVGAGQKFDDLLAIFVGTGIGGGLVLGGQLYYGHFGSAGEIGHTWVCPDAPLGRRTLENLASRTAIANLAGDLIRSNHPSALSDLVEGKLDKIRSKALAAALEKKDPLATQVVRAAAHYIGVSAANMVTVLSLPCVVIGGGLAEALGDTLIHMVRESFVQSVFPPRLQACKIVVSKLGDHAGAIGAGLLARHKLAK